MIYGYARVSTTKQMKNGNSIEDQTKLLSEAGAEKIVADHFTGTKMDRPEFSKLVNELTNGDTLIITKLDRFARTIVEGVSVIRELIERGVTVRILNMGTVENTPTGKVTLSVMMAFAEFERDMIVERTQAGKAIARANGKKVDGRPRKYSTTKIDHAMELLANGDSYTEVEAKTGISKSTLIRRRREQKAEEQVNNKKGTQAMKVIMPQIETREKQEPVRFVIQHKDHREKQEPVKIVLRHEDEEEKEPKTYIIKEITEDGELR